MTKQRKRPRPCLYCGRARVLNELFTCRDCQDRQNVKVTKNAYSALINGTGEDEDAYAERMWDILEGKPGKEIIERGF